MLSSEHEITIVTINSYIQVVVYISKAWRRSSHPEFWHWLFRGRTPGVPLPTEEFLVVGSFWAKENHSLRMWSLTREHMPQWIAQHGAHIGSIGRTSWIIKKRVRREGTWNLCGEVLGKIFQKLEEGKFGRHDHIFLRTCMKF